MLEGRMPFCDTYEILQFAANQWPNHIAVVDEHGRIDYSRLLNETEKLKQILFDAGIVKGQGLGVMARNGRGFIIGLFAGMGCGCTVLPISHQLTRTEIDAIALEANLHAILDDHSGVEPLASEGCLFELGPLLWRLKWTGKDRSKPMVPLEESAFVRFTSGTTGNRKGIVLTHKSVLDRVHAAYKAMKLRHGDIALWVLPIAYHFIATIAMYLRYGITIVICREIFAQNLIHYANTHRATFLLAAPIHYKLLVSEKVREEFHTVKRAISTTATLPVELARAFKRRYDIGIQQAYGLIEAGFPLVKKQVNCDGDLDSVGEAAPGFEIEILNEHLVRVPVGEIGKLGIRGPGMFDAYLSPWQPREEVMRNNWFLTGDLAFVSKAGTVRIVGRENSVINVAGHKAFPEEIEVVLNQHRCIKNSCVYGMTHPVVGEIVCAQIVRVPGAGLDPEEIVAYCRNNLSVFKVPQKIEIVEDIPTTDSGKVIRK